MTCPSAGPLSSQDTGFSLCGFKLFQHHEVSYLSLSCLLACSVFQYDGDLWPQDGLPQTRVGRTLPDTRQRNVVLIPLRGSENEMRNSVAAFSQDPLAVSQSANQLGTNLGTN